jgi:hypothetical protein
MPASITVNWMLAILSSRESGSEKSHASPHSPSAGYRNPKNCLNEIDIIPLITANYGHINEHIHFSGVAKSLVEGMS